MTFKNINKHLFKHYYREVTVLNLHLTLTSCNNRTNNRKLHTLRRLALQLDEDEADDDDDDGDEKSTHF